MDWVAGASRRKIGSEMGVDMDWVAGPSKRKIVSEMGVDANSSTSVAGGGEYEVFLSFRGPDTRYDFTDFLYTSLDGAGVRTFRDDDELRKGGEIGPELLQAIEESRISIPIFSKNYASSKWCLNELTKMVECKRSTGQLILPIFYDVEPSHVRHQSGYYKEAFHMHESLFPETTVKEWKDALGEAGALKGWEVQKETNGYQGKLIKENIVPTVLLELKKNYMVVDDNLVGIHPHVNEMMRLLNVVSSKVRIVGIHGMGGIGKTTIAKIIYNKLLESFECHSFLADVRETAHQHKGLVTLQKKLLKETLNWCPNIDDVNSGFIMIKQRLVKKKVLIVLDDVNDKSQFNSLVGNGYWFSPGSRIIVTTRDKHILNALEVDATYEPPFMDSMQSLKLFSMHAFRWMSPPKYYDNISRRIALSVAGLPLALEVIGSFLSDKELVVWEDTLKKLGKIPHDEVVKKLRISFDALNYGQQQIFLDIACCFFGMDKATLFCMWDGCGYHPNTEFNVLSLMSLVKVGDSNELRMHDQLRALGRKIVCEETSLGKRSRLWDHDEALHVLKARRGTEQVETLSLGFELEGNMERPCFTNEEFAELENLRYLKVDCTDIVGNFKFLLSRLRWLRWRNCIPDLRATNFCMESLVILDLSYSDITEEWAGWSQIKMANKLKVMELAHCDLRRTIDFSSYPNLEILNLESCRSLVEIEPSIGKLKNLKVINISWTSVMKLPNEIWMLQKLEVIDASYCWHLKGDIPSIMGKLSSLRFMSFLNSKVQSLPTSILELTCLQTLNLGYCTNLKMLPELPSCLKTLTVSCKPNLADLVNLQEFHLSCCLEDVEISRAIGKLSKLEKMSLILVSISTLPKEIGALSQLKFLSLRSCPSLESILGLPSNLVDLNIDRCKSLEILADLSSLSNLLKLHILDCPELTEVQGLGELGLLTSLQIVGCDKLANLNMIQQLASLLSLEMMSERKYLGRKANLSNLKSLSIFRCPRVYDLQGLDKLESLKYLSLSSCRSIPNLPNLSLENLKMLRFLNLSGFENLQEIKGLEAMESLKNLSLRDCKSIANLPNLSNLKILRFLKLRDCENLREIKGLEAMESLENLSLRDCKSIANLPNLSNLKILRFLKLRDCENLQEIKGLEAMESLENLSLRDCKSIVNLPDLSNLKMLRFLMLDGCENLQEIKGLEAMESLEELQVSGCPALKNLPHLPNTRILPKWDLNW